MTDTVYDFIILGAGPAGLTAAIYAARYRLKTIVIGPDIGGTVTSAHDIENWPGMKGGGMKIMDKFVEHVRSFDVPIITEHAKRIEKDDNHFLVHTEKDTYKGLTVLLAMGTKRRKLDLPGEEKFSGKGVSHCATCDAMFFKDKDVAVVGGSDAAAMAAQVLSQHAKKVTIIYRKDALRAEPARIKELENDPKIDFIFNTTITEIKGDTSLTGIKLDNGNDLAIQGLFIEIGGVPITMMAKDLGIGLSESNRIKVGADMSTNVEGVFAAGDITTGSNEFNQIVTAASEGAIAALSAFKLSRKMKNG
ncbi:MAG: FAD-dependent oxidoreductase [Candidatus Woesearchaeota archaeon]